MSLPVHTTPEADAQIRFDYAPGRVGTVHSHPGFVLAYVLRQQGRDPDDA